MRTEECNRLHGNFVTWSTVVMARCWLTNGKTAAARPMMPMTPGLESCLEGLLGGQNGKPMRLGLASDKPRADTYRTLQSEKATTKALKGFRGPCVRVYGLGITFTLDSSRSFGLVGL